MTNWRPDETIAQREARVWNDRYPVGTQVIVERCHATDFSATTTSEAFVSERFAAAAVHVSTLKGYVLLSRVRPVLPLTPIAEELANDRIAEMETRGR